MADKKSGFKIGNLFKALGEASQTALEGYIEKAKTNTERDQFWDRKGLVEVEYGTEQQYGWKERRGLVGPGVMKNMRRKDSMVMSIIQTRLSQVSNFAQPQKDKYSPGYKILPKKAADLTREQKIELANPELSDDDRKKKKYEFFKNLAKEQEKQEEEAKQIQDFLQFCGAPVDEIDTTEKRKDFRRFCHIAVDDRLTYNYAAIEKIPTKDGSRLSRFDNVSASTIRYVSKKSVERYQKILEEELRRRKESLQGYKVPEEEANINYFVDDENPLRYVQVIRGRVVAAWTEKEMVFEAANPSVDPEDYGYSPGELELLINLVTAHLFAEAHNRNFFTQGIGTKGILHIKGDNINRAQLEGFKRQWFNQVVSSRNAFRPPIIGIADDVKWVELAQSNKDMEFDNWMNYLIRMSCAVYQIDPAEINFDISKVAASTLNESSNEQRIKSSRDKGLRPLLAYIENLINYHVLPDWDKELAAKYEFKFVGLDAETRKEEAERLDKEGKAWKTVNEVRNEMGFPPIDNGDIILDGAFTQYVQSKEMQEMGGMDGGEPGAGGNGMDAGGEEDEQVDTHSQLHESIDAHLKDLDTVKEEPKDEPKAKKPEETKKSGPDIKVEYYKFDDKD